MKTLNFWPNWAQRVERLQLALPTTIFTKHTHGPTEWPWWKIFSINPVRSSVYFPSTGWNIWVYTRWHVAVVFEFVIVRGFPRDWNFFSELPPYQLWEAEDAMKKQVARWKEKGYSR